LYIALLCLVIDVLSCSCFFCFFVLFVLFIIVFFSFYCYGAPRDLHSFPTRRSSDLGSRARRARRLQREERGARADPAGAVDEGRDRKSTRLNSSHVSISYAVFCLKKKKSEYLKSVLHRKGRYLNKNLQYLLKLKHCIISYACNVH